MGDNELDWQPDPTDPDEIGDLPDYAQKAPLYLSLKKELKSAGFAVISIDTAVDRVSVLALPGIPPDVSSKMLLLVIRLGLLEERYHLRSLTLNQHENRVEAEFQYEEIP